MGPRAQLGPRSCSWGGPEWRGDWPRATEQVSRAGALTPALARAHGRCHLVDDDGFKHAGSCPALPESDMTGNLLATSRPVLQGRSPPLHPCLDPSVPALRPPLDFLATRANTSPSWISQGEFGSDTLFPPGDAGPGADPTSFISPECSCFRTI